MKLQDPNSKLQRSSKLQVTTARGSGDAYPEANGHAWCVAEDGRAAPRHPRNIIGRCKKEAKESKFSLRMIAVSEPGLADEARVLYREAKELHLIFCSMYRHTAP